MAECLRNELNIEFKRADDIIERKEQTMRWS